jgi:type IV secretory pathway VirD2 relaxase
MFDAASDDADLRAFAERGRDDRHHFRFIVSPEDAAEMEDLRAFTRDLVKQMERDLGTRLDWVALDHWNTDNPHIHLIVRGADDRGDTLVIHRDYISHGMRERASAASSPARSAPIAGRGSMRPCGVRLSGPKAACSTSGRR